MTATGSPDIFNAAAYFVDRHIAEGRGDSTAIECGEERVSYEQMVARLGLAGNPALAKIGAIVHVLEICGTTVPEAAGVQTLLQGALRRAQGENELLGEAEKTFDLLYEAYFEPPRK